MVRGDAGLTRPESKLLAGTVKVWLPSEVYASETPEQFFTQDHSYLQTPIWERKRDVCLPAHDRNGRLLLTTRMVSIVREAIKELWSSCTKVLLRSHT